MVFAHLLRTVPLQVVDTIVDKQKVHMKGAMLLQRRDN